MPTTRHHLNNLRRRQAREALRSPGSPDAARSRASLSLDRPGTPDAAGSRESPHTPVTSGAGRPREALRALPTDDAPAPREGPRASGPLQATDDADSAVERGDQPEQPEQLDQPDQPGQPGQPQRTRTLTRTRTGNRTGNRTRTRTRTLIPTRALPAAHGGTAGAAEASSEPAGEDTDPPGEAPARRPASRRALVALCLVTLVLGGFAGWAHARAESLRDAPAARNTALSDTARTSEIKGQSAKAVGALFSYDHADPGALDKAAKQWLTGRAVAQHRNLLGDIRERAAKQKAVITTTVTESAVERIDGDRARVLVFADQSSVSTAGDKKADDDGTYAGAMFAVDVERHDGRWLVSAIDTFHR